jgi:hypothetical protein
MQITKKVNVRNKYVIIDLFFIFRNLNWNLSQAKQ